MMNFYRKFLPNTIVYQSILQNMIVGNKRNDTTLLKWSPDTEAAFDRCKNELSKATLLAHPVSGAEICIYVDASDTAVETALHQNVSGGSQPLAF